MRVLIADPGAGVWMMTPGTAIHRAIPCAFPWPCMPCACQSLMAVCCAQLRDCLCMEKQGGGIISRMPCVPGVSFACLSPCGRYLYQLSSEADCVHTMGTAAGELLFAAPAGVFPRMMHLDHSGERLLVAGGAVNEALLFHAPELTVEKVVTTRHPCFAASFWKNGLVLVCAVEGEDIHTAVYTLAEGKLRPRRLLELSGHPGMLCVCPDGIHALLSTADGLMKIALETGRVIWNRPELALGMRLECREQAVLVSDLPDGSARLIHQERPWEQHLLTQGAAAQACLL